MPKIQGNKAQQAEQKQEKAEKKAERAEQRRLKDEAKALEVFQKREEQKAHKVEVAEKKAAHKADVAKAQDANNDGKVTQQEKSLYQKAKTLAEKAKVAVTDVLKDANGDGKVTPKDIKVFQQDTQKKAKEAKAAHNAEVAAEKAAKKAELLKAQDTNGDGKASVQEKIRHHLAQALAKKHGVDSSEILKDANGDGKVTLKDIQVFKQDIQKMAEEAKAAHKAEVAAKKAEKEKAALAKETEKRAQVKTLSDIDKDGFVSAAEHKMFLQILQFAKKNPAGLQLLTQLNPPESDTPSSSEPSSAPEAPNLEDTGAEAIPDETAEA